MTGEPSPGQVRRILSIDGGGLLSTYPASVLAAIEEKVGKPLGQYFDLIAGTSGGGIIALGLGLGLTARQILGLYTERGPVIFGQGRGAFVDYALGKVRGLRRLVRPKYGSEGLRSALEDVLGARQLGESGTRLMIPAWNPTARNLYVYKTAHHPRLLTDYCDRAVDVALATASAPTFFREHITANDVGLVDGGVWANNPVGPAVIEAVGVLGWKGEELDVLSLGCLEETYRIPKAAGIGTLGVRAIKLLMDGQSKSSMGTAMLLTGHPHSRTAIYRIDHVVPENLYAMDDAGVIGELKGLGFSTAREQFPVLQRVFFEKPAAPFVPCYVLPDRREA
ncbi:MAG: patatin [Betaproteobacteria bacterium]|nr:patatin [Betaproteobacteria bacterium]